MQMISSGSLVFTGLELLLYGIGVGFFWFLGHAVQERQPILSKLMLIFAKFCWCITGLFTILIPIIWILR